MKSVTTTAATAAEAEDIVRALSEGRVRITPLRVVKPSVVVLTPAAERLVAPPPPPEQSLVAALVTACQGKRARQQSDLGTALDICCKRGVSFDTEDLLAAMEGWADRNAIMRRMDAAELAGQVVKLPRGDARRTVAPNGNRARAVQWLPVTGRAAQ
jgi:hypothetical protein